MRNWLKSDAQVHWRIDPLQRGYIYYMGLDMYAYHRRIRVIMNLARVIRCGNKTICRYKKIAERKRAHAQPRLHLLV